MAKPHRVIDGEPRNLIGQPFVPGWVPFNPQPPVIKELPMVKARTHGYYVQDGNYYNAPAGSDIPAGAEFVEADEGAAGQSAVGLRQMEIARKAQAKTAREHAHVAAGGAAKADDDDEPEARDKGAAPENRKKA